MRRILFGATLALMAGIVFCDACGAAGRWVVSGVAAAVLLLFVRRRTAWRRLWLVPAFFLLGVGLLCSAQARHGHTPLSDLVGKEIGLRGTVLQAEHRAEKQDRLYLRVEGETLLCTCGDLPEQPERLIGRELIATAVLDRPDGRRNPRTFDYRRYLRSRGIWLIADLQSWSVTDRPVSLWDRCKRAVCRARERFFAGLSVSQETEGLLRGVLFGDTDEMEADLYTAFRSNGTAHVLAVSGLHVGILYQLFRRLEARRKSRALQVGFLCLLGLYGTAACWSVSVTRAVLLVVLKQVGDWIGRRYDALTALAAAAFLILLHNPYALFGASFQMSFLAVASLLFLTPVLTRRLRPGIAAPVAVQLGLLPYTAYTFNLIPWMGLLCNIPVVYLTSLLVPVGMVAFAGAALGVGIPGMSALLNGLTTLLIRVNALFLGDGRFAVDVVSPPLWLVAGGCCALFLLCSELWYLHRHRRQWKALAAWMLLPLCVAGGAAVLDATPFDRACVVFVDVGQGDCIALRSADGRTVLLDGGGAYGYNTGEKTLKPYLLKNGVRRVSLAAATHLHMDHYQGLQELAACFPVDRLVTTGRTGQCYRLGTDEWIEILWPDAQDPTSEDENVNSLIFKVHWQGLTVLVTGDITAEGEAMLLARYAGTDRLRCDVLKVAHHGSAYSTSDAFLEAVSPQAAVISVGRNRYGHPSQIVIEKLKKQGIMVYRTDVCGAVGLRRTDGRIEVCTVNP